MSPLNIRALRQRQILDATEHLAAQQGWMETTFADICREADVSNGVLTYHFKTKNELMFAVLDDIINRLLERLQSLPQQQELTLAEKVAVFLRTLGEFAASDRSTILLLVQFMSFSVQQPEIAEKIHVLFSSLLQQQVEEAQRENEPLPDDPQVVVKLLHCLALGLVLDPLFLGIDFPKERLVDAATKMFLCYLNPSH